MTPSQQQILEQTAVAGLSTNIDIPCNVGLQGETPFWYINGSVYEFFSIPRSFLPGLSPEVIPIVDSYSGLDFPVVIKELDGTIFQCAIFSKSGRIFGITTSLNVVGESELEWMPTCCALIG